MLIIRLDGIGDALALTPLLAALQAASVPADLVLGEGNAQIFAPGAVRRVEIAPFALRSSTRANLRAIETFAAPLRGRGYTHVLVATEDPAGYRLARAVRAPHRIGFVNGWGKPFKTLWARSLLTRSLYRPAGLGGDGKHECEVLFGLGNALTNEPQPTRDLARLRPLVLENDVPRGDCVAMQITQKWLRFGASVDDVCGLVRELGAESAIRLIAPASEGDLADSVESASGVRVERFATLAPWKSAIANASVLVAPDSGATHVAGMTGTPAVALFPPAQLARQVARWHPWASPYEVVTVEGSWRPHTRAALRRLLGRA